MKIPELFCNTYGRVIFTSSFERFQKQLAFHIDYYLAILMLCVHILRVSVELNMLRNTPLFS